MINFDTFFSSILTLTIFCLTILISLIIERKKCKSLKIASIGVFIIVFYFAVFLITLSLYRSDEILWLSSVEKVKLLIFKCWILPFGRKEFSYSDFYIIYLVGVLSFVPMVIFGLTDLITSKSYELDELIFSIADLVLGILWFPFFSGCFIYNYLLKFSLLIALSVGLIANFFLSFILPFMAFAWDCIRSYIINKFFKHKDKSQKQ